MLSRRELLAAAAPKRGCPGMRAGARFGLCAPAGAPKDVTAKLAKGSTDSIDVAEIRMKLVGIGLEPYTMSPAQFSAQISDQHAKYSRVIDEAGIKS